LAGSGSNHIAKPAEIIAVDHTTEGDGIEEQSQAIARAAQIIHAGGVVVFPAKSLYGLAADALNPKAVERIFKIKQRPLTNPLLVLIDNIGQLDLLVQPVAKERSTRQEGLKSYLSPAALALIEKFWPGSVTLLFNAVNGLPEALTAGSGKIGIRVPGHPVARALVRAVGGPITGTSANISGQSGCKEIAMLDPEILSSVDMVLDSGTLKGGIGSTVVDITSDPVRIVREGQISSDEIIKSVEE